MEKPNQIEGGTRAAAVNAAARLARAGSNQRDVERAEEEGMPSVPSAGLGPDAERHLVRQRALAGRVMPFDLAAESARLDIGRQARHTARTLARLDSMRLTLMKLEAGSTIPEHQTSHHVSIHVLSGHVVLHVEGLPVDMPTGHMLVIQRGVAHDIVAKEDSSVLLTVSAPAA